MAAESSHRNRLADETSPYLLQHAANPVDWYPWGPEAFARASAEDRPILLSVGYSSCHWCHVMAHESFENPATAALMNRDYVNIKVDREERPDVDAVYMTAVQALTGQGGWPMTVFMTPDARPFYAGTYFPPDDAYGRPGFPRLLEAIAEKWRSDRAEILTSAESITAHLQRAAGRTAAGKGEVTIALVDQAAAVFTENFDATWGGFGMAPKFPSPSNLEFLLARHTRVHAAEAANQPSGLDMVATTLRAMSSGGMYDQLGGGFARYSVDDRWLVPHFEKMLYDNAQLARVYLHAFQLTGDPRFEAIVRETLAFLDREMSDTHGGFHAALDADSEGIEGKFYVWTTAEVAAVLGDDAPLFNAWFGVTEAGNFTDPHHPELTGRNVLTARADASAVAARFGIDADELAAKIAALSARMLAARADRVRPGLDDKVLTSWNGLALAAYAEAGRVLGAPALIARAQRIADFVRSEAWSPEGLTHTFTAGRATVPGMLEDYAYVGLGLVELYKATGDLGHLAMARELFGHITTRFHDRANGAFFDTADDGERLLLRQKSLFDAATPSGNSAAALLGVWLARYDNDAASERFVAEVTRLVSDHLVQAATGFGCLLQAMEFVTSPPRELAILGAPSEREPLEREAARRFLPWLVLAPAAEPAGLPLFEGRDAGNTAQAYLCEAMACMVPVSTPRELGAQLQELR
jgi:uncharacterized protein YyaL (SSP411 family)